MRLLFGFSLCLTICLVLVKCETFDECDGIDSGRLVSSPKGCQYYIYCGGDASFEDSCPSDLMFNVVFGICDDPANVNCTDQSVPPTPGATTTTVLTPTTTVSPSSASVPTVSPSTTSTTTVSQSSTSTTLLSSTTTTTTWRPTSSPDGQIVCPQPSRPEEIIYLPNPDSCTDYYMCYKLTAIPMTCPNDLQYNSLTGSCDWAGVVNCQIVGTTTTSPREICKGQYSGVFEYPSNCHYYYRCTNGMLTVLECPAGFGWDAIRKMCTTTACKTL